MGNCPIPWYTVPGPHLSISHTPVAGKTLVVDERDLLGERGSVYRNHPYTVSDSDDPAEKVVVLRDLRFYPSPTSPRFAFLDSGTRYLETGKI